ncbi:hypothetical protein ACFLSZ_05040 [Candidatus Bipolaricaulota bacterium]
MEPVVEFERLQSLIQREASDEMPMSVRMRYEARREELRSALQGKKNAYPLGAILVSIGAVTDRQLNHVLHEQENSHTNKLLGEFLIELGLTSRENLSHALAIQTSVDQVFRPSY